MAMPCAVWIVRKTMISATLADPWTMDQNMSPSPEHANWAWTIAAFFGGLLISMGKKMLGRHETENDGVSKKLDDHKTDSAKLLAGLETRIALLEDRQYVTLPQLELAIAKALSDAHKLFSAEHNDIINKLYAAISKSKEDSDAKLFECNKKVREDFKEDINASMNMMRDIMRMVAKRKDIRNRSRTKKAIKVRGRG
jgi:hypothetical protein